MMGIIGSGAQPGYLFFLLEMVNLMKRSPKFGTLLHIAAHS